MSGERSIHNLYTLHLWLQPKPISLPRVLKAQYDSDHAYTLIFKFFKRAIFFQFKESYKCVKTDDDYQQHNCHV